ncbi:MAG: thioredoxin family protein [Methanomethylovorans sp.]|uniref:glutaredoxin family protein n=1 Tax=Methanomethylovorans sp. TaxID=2758717 RepID=UPI000AC805E8|nr:thioredoxin family protein [Methanomethylovorans sp.]
MVKVTLVTAQWCHFCPTAKKLWRELKEKYDFEYVEVDYDSPEGEKLIEEFSIVSVPTTIIDDKIVFVGVPDKNQASKNLEKAV